MKALLIVTIVRLAPIISSNLVNHCTSTYRSFNGTCNNEEHSDWGQTGQAFSLSDSTEFELELGSVRDPERVEDPVSEWLKELLDVVLEDVFNVDISESLIENMATPYIDLSNIYDPFSGNVGKIL